MATEGGELDFQADGEAMAVFLLCSAFKLPKRPPISSFNV